MNDNSPAALKQRLFKSEFPRSSAYDPHWLIANVMGPHALWLTEWLSERLELTPGMRVLDLGHELAAHMHLMLRRAGDAPLAPARRSQE